MTGHQTYTVREVSCDIYVLVSGQRGQNISNVAVSVLTAFISTYIVKAKHVR